MPEMHSSPGTPGGTRASARSSRTTRVFQIGRPMEGPPTLGTSAAHVEYVAVSVGPYRLARRACGAAAFTRCTTSLRSGSPASPIHRTDVGSDQSLRYVAIRL